jgi:hypothetical protein
VRSDLRTRYPWIAAGITLLICVPNLAWQVAKGFPSLEYITNHQGSGGGLVANLVLIGVYLLWGQPNYERLFRGYLFLVVVITPFSCNQVSTAGSVKPALWPHGGQTRELALVLNCRGLQSYLGMAYRTRGTGNKAVPMLR